MRHQNHAKQLAAIQTAIEARSGDFMKYGRDLIKLRDAAEASGLSLGSLLTGPSVPRRKIYAIVTAVETVKRLGLTDKTAAMIGWSKLSIISGHLTGDREGDEELVQMALNGPQATLLAHVTTRSKGPVRVVHLALTAGLSRRFEKALHAVTGVSSPMNPVKRGKLMVEVLESRLVETTLAPKTASKTVRKKSQAA